MMSNRTIPAMNGTSVVPVQDLELEGAVLGAILSEPAYFPVALRYLKTAEVFYKAEHQDIFRAMIGLSERQQEPGLMDVSMMLREQKSQVSTPYLLELTSLGGLHSNFEQRCVTVFDLHHRRKVYLASILLARDAYDLSVDSMEAGSMFRRRLEEMEASMPDRIGKTLVQMGKEILEDFVSPAPPFIPSGIRAFDEVIGGYEPGCLYILAARPSMGKSAFVCQNLDNIAVKQNMPTGLLLLEGNAKSITRRMACRYGGFSVDDIKQKRITSAVLEAALSNLVEAPLYIDDAPCTLDRLEARIVRLVMQGAKIVFVDYLQRVTDHRPKVLEYDTVSAISSKLKTLASQLNIPIIALSQLSRKCEERKDFDKRPVMSDLRSSGNLEQDADMIGFLFRPEYYGLDTYPEGFPTQHLTEVLVAKNRESAIRTGDDAVILHHRLAQSAYYSSKGEYDNHAYQLNQSNF